MNDSALIEFLSSNTSRVSYGDSWMCVTKENSVGGEPLYDRFTVYSRRYGQKRTRVLYDGLVLSEALEFLKGEK